MIPLLLNVMQTWGPYSFVYRVAFNWSFLLEIVHFIDFKMFLCLLIFFFFSHSFSILLSLFSPVWLFVTPWTVARQAPLSMGFSSKNTGGLSFPSSGDLLNARIEPASLMFPALGSRSLPLSTPEVTLLLPVSKCWCISPWGFVLGLPFLTLSCCLI